MEERFAVDEQKKTKKKGAKIAVLLTAVFVVTLTVCLGILFGLRYWRDSQEDEDSSRSQQDDSADRSEEEKVEWEEEYIFPQSDKKKLRRTQLSKLSEEELLLAKYEILARHGRIFSTPEYADHFEATHWYKPDDRFDEDDLSDIERENIELIDSYLQKKQGSQAAAALLAKLKEQPRSAIQAGVPVDGAYCWLGHPSNGNNTLFWFNGSGVEGVDSRGLLCAAWLDMDHNGEPELLTISLDSGYDEYEGILEIELWKYDGQSAVEAMEPVLLELLLPRGYGSVGSLYYVKGTDRDYFYIPYWSGDMGWNMESSIIITADGKESVSHENSYEVDEYTGDSKFTYETYYIGKTEVTQAEYERKKASLPPMSGGELWLESNIATYNDDGSLTQVGQMLTQADPDGWGLYGALYVNGPEKIAETEAYLSGLAQGDG